MIGGERAQLGDADLEVAQNLEEERFELGIGAVDFVDEEDDGLVAEDGLQEGALQEEAHREEDVFLVGEAVGGFGEGAGAGEGLLKLIAEQLGVQELLGVLPFVERFGLVEAFVALQTDEGTAERTGDGFGQFGFADAGGPFGEQRFAELLRQVDCCGDFVIGDVLLAAERVFGLFNRLVCARIVHVRGRLLWLLASGTRPLRYVVVYLTGTRFARHRNSWGAVHIWGGDCMEGNSCQRWLILFTSFGGGTGQAQGRHLPPADWRAKGRHKAGTYHPLIGGAKGRHKACPYLPLIGGRRTGTRPAPTFR